MIASLVGHFHWLRRGKSTTAAVLQTTLLQAMTIVANIATGILTARMLLPTGRGEVAAIILAPTFLGLFLTFGLPSSLLYNLRRHATEAPALIGAALISTSLFGFIGISIGYFLVPFVLHAYTHDVIVAAQMFLLTVPLTLYMYVCASAFEANGEFWYSNGTRVVAPLLTLCCLYVVAFTRHLNPITAAASYTLPGVLIGAKMVLDVSVRYRPAFLPLQRTAYRHLGSYGLRSFGIDLLKTVGQQIDQLLVVAFLSPAAMGLYTVSLALSRLILLLQSSVVRVLLPRVAARPPAEVVSAAGRAARITFAVTAVPCAILVVAAPLVLHIAYGNKFVDAGSVTRVLALEALFAGLGSTLAQSFLALGKPGTISILQGAGLALSVPLMLALIPRFGLLGAALALLISTLARFGLVLVCFPWLLNISAPGVILTRADIASVVARFRRDDVRSPISE